MLLLWPARFWGDESYHLHGFLVCWRGGGLNPIYCPWKPQKVRKTVRFPQAESHEHANFFGRKISAYNLFAVTADNPLIYWTADERWGLAQVLNEVTTVERVKLSILVNYVLSESIDGEHL